MTTILGLAVCGMLTGAQSFAAIAEWALDASPQVFAALGITGCPPCESTVRRTLQKLGGDDLDTVIGDWNAARANRSTARRATAVDGKTLRGALCPDGRARHLMAAIDPSIAPSLAGWLHQLTAGPDPGGGLLGWGARDGRAMITTLRHRLLCVPDQPIRHANQLTLRLPLDHHPLTEILTRLRALPAAS